MSPSDRARWDDRYREGGHGSRTPSPFLVSQAEWLPEQGRALDIAGGAGRNALFLARRGLDTTLLDVSEVALEIARGRALEAGLPLQTLALDLKSEPLPPGPWHVVVSCLFLHRPLFAQLAEALAPGGLFVFLQPTVTNQERNPRPPRRFLLEPGEAVGLMTGLEVVHAEEGWGEDGYHEARLVMRRPLNA